MPDAAAVENSVFVKTAAVRVMIVRAAAVEVNEATIVSGYTRCCCLRVGMTAVQFFELDGFFCE
ncbi:MAG: hypothetical protein CMM01_24635 [Rhodopirellula sp.]|nr:hypothetical protein [Rhodopirellula sp.]